MNPEFRAAVESLHPAFERLIGAVPYTTRAVLPKKGVYVFYENGKALYVGRSNNIPQRRRQHTGVSSKTTQAALATLIARKVTERKIDYQKGARERLLADREFMDAFEMAKKRVRTMDFRAVEECNQTRQVLLEVYCAIALKTEFNDFGTY